nr:MAG TPA: hypothetical protein [Caudoviricetes sp.]
MYVQKHETKNIFYMHIETRNSEIVLPLTSTRSGIPPSKTLGT